MIEHYEDREPTKMENSRVEKGWVREDQGPVERGMNESRLERAKSTTHRSQSKVRLLKLGACSYDRMFIPIDNVLSKGRRIDS